MRFLILFLFLFSNLIIHAQNDPIKWGKISPEELAMNDYELDPDAEAVVLCDYGIIKTVEKENGGFQYQFNRIRRVKILKESGLDRGNIFIPYQHYNAFHKLRKIRAQVFAPDGSKQSVAKKDIFNEVKNKYWSSKNFTMPNLQVGSVFEYHYEIVSDGLTHLTDWYFQEDIPVAHSELKITIAQYFEYIFLLNGYELTNASQELKASEYGSSLKIVKATNPFILQDIPAIEEENFITCMDDYRLGIRFQLSKINYSDGRKETILDTWEGVAKKIEEHRYIGQQYNNIKNHRRLLAAAKPAIDTAIMESDKVKAACEFLQSNLTFSGYYGDVANDHLDKLFDKKEVSFGEMNLMLMALLKAYDIEVYPLLVSTRSHGKMIPNYPIIDQFNHLMVYAMVNGEETILDLGSSYRPPNIPRTNALNGIAWLVNGPDSKWIDIKPTLSKQTIMVNAKINDSGILEAQVKGRYSAYDAVDERYALNNEEDANHWQKRLNEQFPEAEVTAFSASNKDDVSKDYKDQFDCTIPDAIQESGDLLYLQPILYSDNTENPLKLKNRFYPIDINYPTREQYIFNFTMPEGYTIESVPENINIAIHEKGATFFYKSSMAGNILQVSTKLQLNKLSYSPFEYGNLKEFFDRVFEKLQEPILLKKTGN